jgi:hypothetical protein
MLAVRNRTAALYVDKSGQQWIARDPEGNFWIIPCVETPGTIANRTSRPMMRSSGRSRDITRTCSACLFRRK